MWHTPVRAVGEDLYPIVLPRTIKDPNATERGRFATLSGATVVDLYQELAALADREVNVAGDILVWPSRVKMLGDFHGREQRS